ncbi:uncharacterized protein A1O9_00106 [Exophiala aquamarina CBS 119918]|uniref:Uncharacterized protein n=1 Tax=Exophiala aquamarina CBS 119918 TaxID=1182545 RepID=A0A072PPU3_9EURO|nr:uncharacterized protein A1O9_00106 [Exophiala aquamarina CBS 119918]KEF62134.1 hypothetical protein A1O9_00106 [Exophiala aquamarina CBS 119918]
MNQLHLRQSLGTLAPETLRRRHYESVIDDLAHQKRISFSYIKQEGSASTDDASAAPPTSAGIAHQAGVNCLAIDRNEGQFLFSGGADSTVRLWDLSHEPFQLHHRDGQSSTRPTLYHPKATLSRSSPSSHTHALTSISIYPFDPIPSTLLTTSYDKTLKVTSITPSGLTPLHTFELSFTPYTHSLSPLVDSHPLIAVGTAHPAIRLLDLRTGLATHSMTGPNGAVYSVAWSPRASHILASGSSDGRVLFFDVRRANAAFASLDLDDAVGVVGIPAYLDHDARREQLLDFNAVAHNGPVTGVQWTPSGDKIVTSGHDQRIRVWDAATGRNDLVHFGPRIRNERPGELKPLISPAATHMPGRESLFWANDEPRGFIFQHHLREGHMLKVLRTEGVKLAQVQAASASVPRRGSGVGGRGGRGGRGGAGTSNHSHTSSSSVVASRVTGSGRINAMVWRVQPIGRAGALVEMYTAHGDGRIGVWLPSSEIDGDAENEGASDSADTRYGQSPPQRGMLEEPSREVENKEVEEDGEAERRKRKRALIGDLVEGLAKRPVPFL